MLIALEGLDAAGKATQAKLLAERFDRAGRITRVFSFPQYNTALGRIIKAQLEAPASDPLILQALMLADKAVMSHEIWWRRKEEVVVCDRWTPSALCYGAADGIEPALLRNMNETLPIPDVCVFLDVPPEEALRRRPALRDRFERDRAKQAVVREKYRELWAHGQAVFPHRGWARVDGVGTIEEVHERVWLAVQP